MANSKDPEGVERSHEAFIRSRMERLEPRDLQRIAAVETGEWDRQAVQVARDVMRERSIAILTAEEFLGMYPEEQIGASGFCLGCEAVTIAAPCGRTGGGGLWPKTRLHVDRSVRCERCRSREARRWVYIFFLPLIPLGRYRVIERGMGVDTDQQLSRRIGTEPGQHPSQS